MEKIPAKVRMKTGNCVKLSGVVMLGRLKKASFYRRALTILFRLTKCFSRRAKAGGYRLPLQP